jgi:PAS domain S-box-containing protein
MANLGEGISRARDSFFFMGIFSCFRTRFRPTSMSAPGNALSKFPATLDAKFFVSLESFPEAIILVDSAGSIVLASEAAEKLFGYSRGELTGVAAETLLPPRLRGATAFKKSLAGIELFGFRKNHSEFAIEFTHQSLPAEEGAFDLAVIRDLTERKRLEREVKEKNAALEVARQEFQSFSYSVSHDFRAPLRAVDGFASMLKKSLGENLSQESAHALGRVQENVSKMSKLLDGLLDFSALSWVAMTKKTLKPAAVVHKSYASLALSADGRKIDWSVGELPACDADEMLLRRLFDCLLSNAVKFTRKSDTAKISVGCREEKGERVYFVQDNGAGFDMEYVSRLFQLFQRLHSTSEFEGTGIGLALAQRIVQRHGGRIWATGEVGRGATFYFTLGEPDHGHSA